MSSNADPKDTKAVEAEVIEPIPFRAATGGGRRVRAAARWLAALSLGAVTLALAGAVGFVFTAREVSIHIDPRPESLFIEGGLLTPRIGDYYLMRPGSYTLRAALDCHREFEHRFDVGAGERQEIRLAMQRLPGRLRVQAHREGHPEEPVQDAPVLVDEQAVGATPLQDIEAAQGRRRISIPGGRYRPAAAEVEVEGCGRLQEVNLALTPNWAAVSLGSVPSGAAVKVDGQPRGNTPLQLDLAAGPHEIEISAERHKTWRGKVDVRPDEPLALPEVRLDPADGRLAVRSTPAGASVTIGNRYAGLSPLDVDLAPGKEQVVQLSKAGHEKASLRVIVASGESKTIEITLSPQEGILHFVVEPADAELLVDGSPRGQVPQELRLAAVEHDVEIRRQGFEPFRARIMPRPGFPQELRVTLKRSGAAAAAAATAAVSRAPNGYELKLVRPGSFRLGSSRREQGRRSNETLKTIRLSRSFFIGLREVSNREFREFLAAHTSGAFKTQSLNADELPAVQVAWEQAALFCNWLSVREGLTPVYVQKDGKVVAGDRLGTGYRLPTEAEWEFCARSGLQQPDARFPWGNGYPPPAGAGNFADESAKGLLDVIIAGYNDGYLAAAPPAKFSSNALGLYDLGGNVAEWCHDFYAIDPQEAQHEQVDPAGPAEGAHHVVKGASWKQAGITQLRIALRDYSAGGRPDLGFRICRYAE